MTAASSPPCLSVVVPCLNRARYLPATLESILTQEGPPVECVVMDGGSTDGTREILDAYSDRLAGWVSEPDGGQAEAIRTGWSRCRAEFLTWLNADDLWKPGAVRAWLEAFQAHPEADVVYGHCESVDDAGRILGMTYWHAWDLAYAVEYADHCIPQPASVIRRSALGRVGGLDTTFTLMDCELWPRIGRGGGILPLEKTLAQQRACSSGYPRLRFARDRVRLTRKFFRTPPPPPLAGKRRRALSNAYLRGIDDLRCATPKPRGWILRFLFGAVVADPTNLRQIGARLRGPVLRLAGKGHA